ncbi:hypothetical protein BQ8794_270083 [Mesorhizobium prunaredense]|uniref:Uncharacterized protein n=1 Tax=Mesorhizobium prunaredense TaxID=1631249 RepID=A0A1R3V8Q9_9HYPH|nr:hypothetical protein BQ8794_270083 [Mesorhizobium prunaredense]
MASHELRTTRQIEEWRVGADLKSGAGP